MKNLHSLAFYALVAPAITLSSGAVLAEQSTNMENDRNTLGSQSERRGDTQANPGATSRDQGSQRTDRSGPMSTSDRDDDDRSDAMSATDRQDRADKSGMHGEKYMSSAPSNGTQASDLIGASVKTSGGEDVGSVDDLIIDNEGHIVAVTVGVGGFLGMGQKDVAISWDQVTKSGDSDDLELRIDATRDDLRNAPEFERRD